MAKIWPPQGDDSPSFGFKTPCCCTVHGPALDVFESRSTSQNSQGVCKCGCPFGGKVYKTRTLSGTLHSEFFTSCGEEGEPAGSSDETYSGGQTFDPEGCYPANCTPDLCAESTLQKNGDDLGQTCNGLSPDAPADAVENETDVVFTGSGVCQDTAGLSVVVTGSVTDAFSNEDTNDDAIARMLAHAGASDEDESDQWTTWDSSGEGFSWYAPTDNVGPCFFYLHGVWRLRRNHLVPGQQYTVTVELWRADWSGIGSPDPGDYSLFGVQSVDGTADADGLLKLDPVVIPNAVGTMTQTKKSTLTVTPS